MIDISQLTSLISAFRVETEKESISPETVGSLLQAIADLLATATSESEYNILRFWKETLQQFRFLYDIQQRNVDDHSNVILSLMARSMVDGAASSLTLPIGPASRTQAGVMTAEDYTFAEKTSAEAWRAQRLFLLSYSSGARRQVESITRHRGGRRGGCGWDEVHGCRHPWDAGRWDGCHHC